MEDVGASFPVVFFDGDREVELGPVAVYPSLGFRKLQTMIGEKIGVSPHQISVSLVRRKKARSSPEVRRKVPIHESTDFSALAKERDSFLLAVLRRSRRERRGRGRRGGYGSATEDSVAKTVLPQELTILKRIPAVTAVDPALSAVGLWHYDAHIRELQRQRERYLMSTAAAPYNPYIADVAGLQKVYVGNSPSPPATPDPTPVCELCTGLKSAPGEDGGAFHWCVRDAVTVGFRSPVGPIQRPSKVRVDASA